MRDDLWRLLSLLSPFEHEVDLMLVEAWLRIGGNEAADDLTVGSGCRLAPKVSHLVLDAP